ncbi:hypothetical protein [Streptomyces sp. WMMB303]|uniref:hypothetical protein n=1 Tax=Streptomyces sp. WMMB303 TaxID=3034154 RepID=UPI0023ECF752|nr:hypothetical protein [Streptomyces sp. WMMB303]MDF4252784.1 hypothetical protein [Streptomyces sp. WMMB303]
MDPELITVASTTLVGVMVSDGWDALRGRVVALFKRGEADAQSGIEEQLDGSVEWLRQHPTDRQTVESAWRDRFEQLLTAHPQAVADVEKLFPGAANRNQSGAKNLFHNSTVNGLHTGTGDQHNTFRS